MSGGVEVVQRLVLWWACRSIGLGASLVATLGASSE
jgi:hypothetical protein